MYTLITIVECLDDQKKAKFMNLEPVGSIEITPKIGARQKLRIYGQKWYQSTPFDP